MYSEANGVLLELVQNDGNNKSCQNLYQVVVCPCPRFFFFFFQMMTLSWPWPFLWQFQICFLVLLYGWQLIQHLVLMYFQVWSNSSYPQHSGERYRTNGHLVLFWVLRPVKIISLILNRASRKVGRKLEIPRKITRPPASWTWLDSHVTQARLEPTAVRWGTI